MECNAQEGTREDAGDVGLVARTPRNLDPREAGWGPFLRMAVWLARAACPVQPPAPALVVRKLLALEELLPICCPGLPERWADSAPLGAGRTAGGGGVLTDQCALRRAPAAWLECWARLSSQP
jgi:hypothetical protein